jgi:hypothetical protein
LQPVAFGFCFLWQNPPAVLFPAYAEFRDGVSFRLRIQLPEELVPVSVSRRPKPLLKLKPCDPVIERTFPVFIVLLRHPGLLVHSLRHRLS